jgi:hypothetical protein
MNDEGIGGAWATLEPAFSRRQRIDARVFAWLEAHDTPLAAEWLGLFKAAPLYSAGLVAASVVSLLTAPPLAWLALAFR